MFGCPNALPQTSTLLQWYIVEEATKVCREYNSSAKYAARTSTK